MERQVEQSDLDCDDTYSLLLYGGGTLFALWLASVVVGAIDSIPLENRDELVAKLQVLKKQVLRPDDD
ncbi:hypothetical protein DVH24_014431 [Malus domestica]|uniref:Uncharacterized protein n=1 Tax=Malus domestica TaxID=3750 RepID=A0A498KQ79_MALDO|nr:hypothetical protein DVH24_014431 [Malus domestica]